MQSLHRPRLGDLAEVFAGIGVSREDTVERPGEKLPVIGVRDLQDGAVSARDALDTVGFPDPTRADTYAVRRTTTSSLPVAAHC